MSGIPTCLSHHTKLMPQYAFKPQYAIKPHLNHPGQRWVTQASLKYFITPVISRVDEDIIIEINL